MHTYIHTSWISGHTGTSTSSARPI